MGRNRNTTGPGLSASQSRLRLALFQVTVGIASRDWTPLDVGANACFGVPANFNVDAAAAAAGHPVLQRLAQSELFLPQSVWVLCSLAATLGSLSSPTTKPRPVGINIRLLKLRSRLINTSQLLQHPLNASPRLLHPITLRSMSTGETKSSYQGT
jgi:hypothetical protein